MNHCKEFSKFVDFEFTKLNSLGLILLKRVKDQILELSNKLPSKEFTEQLITELKKQTTLDLKHEFIVITESFVENYDVFEVFDRFPEHYLNLRETIQNLKKLMEYAQSISSSQLTIKHLNEIHICYN